MFERFKRHEGNGGTAVAERPAPPAGGPTAVDTRPTRATDADRLHTVRARQREQYGGINWGAAFFGWLVAVGLGALLVGLLAAAGAAVGITELSDTDAAANTDSIGIGGAIALLAALAVAYYCGGYVAGRMSRFDGARQGGGAWVIGLLVTLALAIAGAALGSEYNVLDQLDLPALPVDDTEFATGGAIALVAVVLVTLLAAVFGGKAGERFHRKVDRAGYAE
jgi:hypothetical protein